MSHVTMQSDPENHEAIWIKLGSLAALVFGGRPIAAIYSYSSETRISKEVEFTHGAGVVVKRWGAWVRKEFNKGKLPEKRIVPQKALNDEVGVTFLGYMVLSHEPIEDAQAAIRLDHEAQRRGEPPILQNYERSRADNLINFFQTMRNTFGSTITGYREDAKKLRDKAEAEAKKRKEPEEDSRNNKMAVFIRTEP